MSATVEDFVCLRCDHRYRAEYDKAVVVGRSCPKCGSNSVRVASKEGAEAAAVDDGD